MDKFIPENKELDPIPRLLNKSETSDKDIEEAIEDWKKDPPDDKFKDILEAEIDD